MENAHITQIAEGCESWIAGLDDFAVEYLALDTDTDSELLVMVRTDPRWRVELEDGPAVLFVRTALMPEPSPVCEPV
jgi:hypothetical protein